MSSILAVKKSMSRLTMRAQRLQHGNMLQPATVVVVARNPGPGLSGQHILDAVHLTSTQDDLTNWPRSMMVYENGPDKGHRPQFHHGKSWKYIGKYGNTFEILSSLPYHWEPRLQLCWGLGLCLKPTETSQIHDQAGNKDGKEASLLVHSDSSCLCLAGNFREWPIITGNNHPSNPQQPIQQPYVKRTSKRGLSRVVHRHDYPADFHNSAGARPNIRLWSLRAERQAWHVRQNIIIYHNLS